MGPMESTPSAAVNVRPFVISAAQTDQPPVLRVFQVSDPCSGSSTPIIQEDPKERTLLARGQGGATISEVVNLWKSNWPVGKGVNDVNWGVAGKPLY